MRLLTIPCALLLVIGALVPATWAFPYEEHANSTSCQNRYIEMGPPSTVLAGGYCAVSHVNWQSSEHMHLVVYPVTGFDVRGVDMSFYAFEDGYPNGWNHSAPPVYECTEGFENDVYYTCPDLLVHGDTETLDHGKYVVVARLDVNRTEIAPTFAGTTIPTGSFLSGGTFGFELHWNHRP